MRYTNPSVMFDKLFEIENPNLRLIDNMYYGWFYFRKSPRNNVKFGITHLLWERLRMQQQGTDEEIQFDHVWLMRAKSKKHIDSIESKLKNFYSHYCLHTTTKRAGHTEWYTHVDLKEFTKLLKTYSEEYGSELVKVPLKKPYTATNSGQCPLGLPTNDRFKGKEYIQEWTDNYWKRLIS
jgi:hypothetical protein